MSLGVAGQRCLSEREPELGLGLVVRVDSARIEVDFPASGEKRLYACGAAAIKRVRFRPGETVALRDGPPLLIETVTETAGLLTYSGQGKSIREDALSGMANVNRPPQRLMAAQVDPSEIFDLRLRTLQTQARLRQSDLRGYLGGRLELIPHQLYLLHEVSSRQQPRVLLADEVGLGKTIEACLILHRLLLIGQVRRALVLVPESLVHQWFVELLRRFNLWFSLYDEERCLSGEQSDPEQNPFHAAQLALCSVAFLAGNETRRAQAIAAGWDLLIVDEAHHLTWSPTAVSPEYALVEQLARRTPGLLLLTATPTQLGLAGHFARLRLLDPHRYPDYAAYQTETERFGRVAAVTNKLVEQKPLQPKDQAILREIFHRDRSRLDEHLGALQQGRPGARETLIKTLLDQHGTGRVMFRSTRAAMNGFPQRRFCPAPIATTNLTLLARCARELQAEETGGAAGIRYSFREDPRLAWLVTFLQTHAPAKVLLICKSPRKVLALAAALQEKTACKIGLFHEGLSLVQRDRQAAWFAEPEGAQILLCSEIGSEGRNFQFAHHLVLFDLPLDPGLVEQRIGRLDRIGQTETIRLHVPYLVGSAEARLVAWLHEGLDVFNQPWHSGGELLDRFHARLLELVCTPHDPADFAAQNTWSAFLAETAACGKALRRQLHQGRDRLLELHSLDRAVAECLIARIRAAETEPTLRKMLVDLLDHFGVRIREEENGDLFLDPSHAYVESFPSLPPGGMLATFSRSRAIAREDLGFLSPDHPLVQDAIDLLLDSPAGTTAFATLAAPRPNLLLEAVFVLEAVTEHRWRIDAFLAPTPLRVVVDLRGQDLTADRDQVSLADYCEDADLHRFLERPGFDRELLNGMLANATQRAEASSRERKAAAHAQATAALSADLQRLVDLSKVNDHVRPEEIALATAQLEQTQAAIHQARLRLDSLRLIVEGPGKLA